MPVYLVVVDDNVPTEKLKQKFPSALIEVFSNTFLMQYELADWQLNDEIAELIHKDCPTYEIIITEIDKSDVLHINDKVKYLKYLFDKEKLEG